jgi:hypothetical protein
MRVKELFEGRGPDLLTRRERGPAEQHVTDQQGADVIKPLSHLRKMAFSRAVIR